MEIKRNRVEIFISKEESFHGDVVNFAMIVNNEPVNFSSVGFNSFRYSYPAKDSFFQKGEAVACRKGANILSQFLELEHLDGDIEINNGAMFKADNGRCCFLNSNKISDDINPEKLIKKIIKRNFWIRLAMRNMNFNTLG
ncbi:MAG: hypothetical protein V1865_02480 [bacterium]